MVEVLSGAIQIGVKYTVANLVDGTGNITYEINGVPTVFTHGKSFVGQLLNDTYTASIGDIKVYEDNTDTEVYSIGFREFGEESPRFPENLEINTLSVLENFNANEDVKFPENSLVFSLGIIIDDVELPRIINT